jgi:hypothetical protein
MNKLSYILENITNFFWWLSVTDKDVIKQCAVREQIIYSIKGQIILLVAIFGSFSGGYAIFTITKISIYSIFFGVLWGWLILSIDRLLVSSYKKSRYAHGFEKFIHNTIKPLTLRLPIAIVLGLLISIPLVLKIFQPEIDKKWSNIYIGEKSNTYIGEKEVKLKNKINNYKIRLDTITKRISTLKPMMVTKPKVIKVNGKDVFTTTTEPVDLKGHMNYLNQLRDEEKLLGDSLKKFDVDFNLLSDALKTKMDTESPSFGERYLLLQDLLIEKQHLKRIYDLVILFVILVELLPILVKIMGDPTEYDRRLEEKDIFS